MQHSWRHLQGLIEKTIDENQHKSSTTIQLFWALNENERPFIMVDFYIT
jgi:hypothetical protein